MKVINNAHCSKGFLIRSNGVKLGAVCRAVPSFPLEIEYRTSLTQSENVNKMHEQQLHLFLRCDGEPDLFDRSL